VLGLLLLLLLLRVVALLLRHLMCAGVVRVGVMTVILARVGIYTALLGSVCATVPSQISPERVIGMPRWEALPPAILSHRSPSSAGR
jgi:hypothetical protein